MEIKQIQEQIKENNKKLSSSGWLLNQYPLIKDRLQKENYLNFDNLNQFAHLGIKISEVRRFLKETEEEVVILLSLNPKLKPTIPIILVGSLATYYPQYELFRESLNLKPFGWIEIFHNSKKE